MFQLNSPHTRNLSGWLGRALAFQKEGPGFESHGCLSYLSRKCGGALYAATCDTYHYLVLSLNTAWDFLHASGSVTTLNLYAIICNCKSPMSFPGHALSLISARLNAKSNAFLETPSFWITKLGVFLFACLLTCLLFFQRTSKSYVRLS